MIIPFDQLCRILSKHCVLINGHFCEATIDHNHCGHTKFLTRDGILPGVFWYKHTCQLIRLLNNGTIHVTYETADGIQDVILCPLRFTTKQELLKV